MNGNEITTDVEQLIQLLGDRIEQVERTLYEDEDFCNKDIDATYEAAVKYFKTLQEKSQELLQELKRKLDQIREENVTISLRNKKQFDDEIEEINQLFSSGKHLEACEKLHDYEKRFEQRTTVIGNIPKLFMKPVPIAQYFSFDKPLSCPSTPSNENKSNATSDIRPTSKLAYRAQNSIPIDGINIKNSDFTKEPDLNKSMPIIQQQRLDSQQNLLHSNTVNRDNKSPSSIGTARSLRFSTRLSPSPSSLKNQASLEDDAFSSPTMSLGTTGHRKPKNNYTHTPSTLTSPNLTPTLSQRCVLAKKASGNDVLTATYVLHFEDVQHISVSMVCNKDYIVMSKSRNDKFYSSHHLNIIDRTKSHQEHNIDSHDGFVLSMGFINQTCIYTFTESHFLVYSLESFSKLNSFILSNDYQHNIESNVQKHCIGTVHNQSIYHVIFNRDFHWILSIFNLETMQHEFDYNLTEKFPDVKRYIHMWITDQTIIFLVEIDGSRFAVLFFSSKNLSQTTSQPSRILLHYAENPLTVCPIFVQSIQKYIFLINDPSAKVIHVISNEKYLRSCSLKVYAFHYIEHTEELILVCSNGIYSINRNDELGFFL